MVGRLRRWRPLRLVLVLALVGLGAGGCSVAGIDMAIDDACDKAGVVMVDWDVSDIRPRTLTVIYDGTGGDGVPAAEGEAGHLAKAIWTGVPVGFQRLTVQSRAGTVTGSWTRAELTKLYGPRPPGLDRDYDRGDLPCARRLGRRSQPGNGVAERHCRWSRGAAAGRRSGRPSPHRARRLDLRGRRGVVGPQPRRPAPRPGDPCQGGQDGRPDRDRGA